MSFQLDVLGEPRLADPSGSPVPISLGKPFALLAYVACREDPVPRSELADLLWPGTERIQSRHSLRQALWLLRSSMGTEVLEGKESLRVLPGALDTDLTALRSALAEGRIQDARSYWRGPFLHRFSLTRTPGWAFWVDQVRQDLELRFRRALIQEGATLREKGALEEALAVVTQAMEVSPLFQEAHTTRVELLTELFRLDAAREALADAHSALGDEDGFPAELQLLEARVGEVARAKRLEGAAEPLLGDRPEFVGRAREVAAMEGLWRRSSRGTASHALISGAAGIGKSRLAREVQDFVVATGGVSVMVKGNRGESALRLGLGMDLVRSLLPLPGAAGISAASDGLLKSLVPSLAIRSASGEEGRDPPLAPLLDAVVDLVASISQEAPLFIFVDDLQWADPESRLLMVGLARRLRDARCLLVGAARAEGGVAILQNLRDTFLVELGGREFQLGPLTREEVAELLAFLAEFARPEDAAAVVDRIHAATRGNPLFIGELLKKFIEDGAIRESDGGWILHVDLLPDDLTLPGYVRTLIRARLEGLSTNARILTLTLARETRGKHPDRLRSRSGLGEAEIAGAIAELIRKEVVLWTQSGLLEFTHDELRDTATLTGDDPLNPGMNGSVGPPMWSRSGILAAAALVVMVAGAFGFGTGWPFGSAPPPPFGGGQLIFEGLDPGGSIALAVEEGPPEAWTAGPYQRSLPAGARWEFQLLDGEKVWFGVREDSIRGPDVTRVFAGGTSRVILGGDGDHNLWDLAPDGGEIAFSVEDTEAEGFALDLLAARPDGSDPRLLLRGTGPMGPGKYSPDGDLFAVVIEAPEDTVAFLSRDGRRVADFVGGEVIRLSWCGSSVMTIVETTGGTLLQEMKVGDARATTVAVVSSPKVLACSPDGTAVVHAGINGHRPVMLLRNRVTGSVHELQVDVSSFSGGRWEFPPSDPVVLAVRALEPEIFMAWGDRRELDAVVEFTDGTRRADLVNWTSLDPEVVSVIGSGTITANREGVARIVAGWGHSFRDTVTVTVEYGGSGSAFLSDRFRSLDTTRWIRKGHPAPVVEDREGEPVLVLNGDEKYTDGLVLRRPVPMARGVTVEWEFRLEPTRNLHQSFSLCLEVLDPTRMDAEGIGVQGGTPSVCFAYPAGELSHFDPHEAVLIVSPLVKTRIHDEGAFPASDWTHVALQVRADGEVSVFVNREQIGTSPVYLPTENEGPWTLTLTGKGVGGAEPWVRELAVWEELRYLVRE